MGGLIPMSYYEKTFTLAVTSPVQTPEEPLTLTDVQTYIGNADFNEVAILSSLIPAAREIAEGYQWRLLTRAQWVMVIDEMPSDGCIELASPLVSVDGVRYRDSSGDWTTLTEDTHFVVDTVKQPGRVMPMWGQSWPSGSLWPSSGVEITFTAGLTPAEVPARLKLGMLYLVSLWYNNRIPVEVGSLVAEVPLTAVACLMSGSLRGPR